MFYLQRTVSAMSDQTVSVLSRPNSQCSIQTKQSVPYLD